jgi:2-dehydro-3-deoxygalactonokinase
MTSASPAKATICVDMGTTNARLWIVQGATIVARLVDQVGLRNAARERDPAPVRAALACLIVKARSQAAEFHLDVDSVLAAGMLTSPLGLYQVPHLVAPAGENELARSIRKFSDPEVTDLPIYLVPGVRSGPDSPALEDLANTDLLRGEETLVVGLLHEGILSANSTLLNLGSHWKAIAIDQQARIASSFTTLSGEFIHALQTQTVLASALPQGRLEDVDLPWLERGRAFANRNGTSRAMFAVRLLEQIFHVATPAAYSFLLGAIVESDLNSMDRAQALKPPVLIVGTGAVPHAWRYFLESMGRPCKFCGPDVVERAFALGLLRLIDLHQLL